MDHLQVNVPSLVRATPADNFKFKKNLIENDGVAFLFEKHVLNMCLFFEEAHESTQDGVNKLVDKGPFDHSRWKLLKAMHSTGLPSASCTPPHYMRLFHEFCEAFSAFQGSMKIHIYQPHVNYATDFLSVLNVNVVQIIGEDPDLESLFSFEDNKSQSPTTADERQQGRHYEYGYTGDISTPKIGSENGIARPNVHKGTSDDGVSKFFRCASKLTEVVPGPGLGSGHIFHDDCTNSESEQHMEFARRIHPANQVHAFRKHETTVENPLKCHVDLQNSSHPK
jgi:hypothetical protein